jgi:hypothetical protein
MLGHGQATMGKHFWIKKKPMGKHFFSVFTMLNHGNSQYKSLVEECVVFQGALIQGV